MIFRQLFDQESSTYTYILGDPVTRYALIIDPVKEQKDRDLQLLFELELKLTHIFETHVHADHVTSAAALRAETQAEICISKETGARGADHYLVDQEVFQLDSLRVVALSTPGHTKGCMSYWVGDRVFTGDTLMIRATGRTDFQEGCPENLYSSIQEKLFALRPETLVYPAHDYLGRTVSTIDEEKKWNPRVTQGLDYFVGFMRDRRLPYPKKMNISVPSNMRCGEMEPMDLDLDVFEQKRKDCQLIDVRTPEEYLQFHLDDTVNVPLGEDFARWLEKADKSLSYIFICARGIRSQRAALMAREAGFYESYSIIGGLSSFKSEGACQL